MKQNFIKQLLHKIIANQLRKPSGLLAGKVGNEMNKSNAALYDFTIGAMQLGNNESVLEIGFGNGKFFDKLFTAANDLNVAGLDFSPAMVQSAQRNNPSPPRGGKLNLQMGNSNKLPFADNSFDKVFCINVVYFWEEPAAHLKEIYRVLKPGGRFYTTIRSNESLAQMPFTKYNFNIYTQDEWGCILQAASFQLVGVEKQENEPDAKGDKSDPAIASLCIIAEKK